MSTDEKQSTDGIKGFTEEAKKARKKLEDDMGRLCSDFYDATGLYVRSITFHEGHSLSGRPNLFFQVEVAL